MATTLSGQSNVTLEPFRQLQVNIPNNDLISSIEGVILSSYPEINPHWATSIATSTLVFTLSKVRVITLKGSLKLNTDELAIGIPGIAKSAPLSFIMTPMLNLAADVLNSALYPGVTPPPMNDKGQITQCDLISFILPSRFSVEGMIKYLSLNPNARGGVIIEEFNRVCTKYGGYQADIPDFLTEVYDGYIQPRITIAHGMNIIKDLYISVISCTTPNGLYNLPISFWTGGMGTRTLHTYIPVEGYVIQESDVGNYGLPKSSQLNDDINNFGTYLANNWLEIHRACKSLNRGYLEAIIIDKEGVELMENFRIVTEVIWKREVMLNSKAHADAWDIFYLKRLQANAYKLAAIYSISRNWSRLNIIITPDGTIPIWTVDVKRAILRLMTHVDDFMAIANLKKSMVEKERPKDRMPLAMSILVTLEIAPNKMLNSTQWFEAQTITGRPSDFNEYKKMLFDHGLIKEVERSTITDPQEIVRLALDHGATKVYTPVH